jgi:hypothetical protein
MKYFHLRLISLVCNVCENKERQLTPVVINQGNQGGIGCSIQTYMTLPSLAAASMAQALRGTQPGAD